MTVSTALYPHTVSFDVWRKRGQCFLRPFHVPNVDAAAATLILRAVGWVSHVASQFSDAVISSGCVTSTMMVARGMAKR